MDSTFCTISDKMNEKYITGVGRIQNAIYFTITLEFWNYSQVLKQLLINFKIKIKILIRLVFRNLGKFQYFKIIALQIAFWTIILPNFQMKFCLILSEYVPEPFVSAINEYNYTHKLTIWHQNLCTCILRSLATFRRQLKTMLFTRAYGQWCKAHRSLRPGTCAI
jgi:hypothetical protein